MTTTFMDERTRHQPVCKSKSQQNLNSACLDALETSELTDITFKVNNTEIRAHKLVLTLGSKVFKKFLQNGMQETTAALITLAHDLDAFNAMLHFLYTDMINYNRANARKIIYLADYYDIESLKQQCELHIIEHHFTEPNWIDVFELGDETNSMYINENTIRFVQVNISKIRHTTDWDQFTKRYPQATACITIMNPFLPW